MSKPRPYSLTRGGYHLPARWQVDSIEYAHKLSEADRKWLGEFLYAHYAGVRKGTQTIEQQRDSDRARYRNSVDVATSDEWSTPKELFNACNSAFGPFSMDAAATAKNTLCPHFISKDLDALKCNVGNHRVWLNPPYSRGQLNKFMGWSMKQTIRSAPVICALVPHYSSESWWQRHVFAPQLDLGCRLGIQEDTREGMTFLVRHWAKLSIWFHPIAGRVKFTEANGSTGPARYSSAIVVYERPNR